MTNLDEIVVNELPTTFLVTVSLRDVLVANAPDAPPSTMQIGDTIVLAPSTHGHVCKVLTCGVQSKLLLAPLEHGSGRPSATGLRLISAARTWSADTAFYVALEEADLQRGFSVPAQKARVSSGSVAVSVLCGLPGSRVKQTFTSLCENLSSSDSARWAAILWDGTEEQLLADFNAITDEISSTGATSAAVRMLLAVSSIIHPSAITWLVETLGKGQFFVANISTCVDTGAMLAEKHGGAMAGPVTLALIHPAWCSHLVFTGATDRMVMTTPPSKADSALVCMQRRAGFYVIFLKKKIKSIF
jgi:hypothetical protein